MCVKDYQIPGTNNVIEKGVHVFIPALGLHMDPKYYANPEKFDPDRFNGENATEKNISNRPYYAFGEGQRNCIAMRYGKLQTKVGLVMMLRGFRFDLEEKLRNSGISFDPKLFIITPLEKIQLQVLKR